MRGRNVSRKREGRAVGPGLAFRSRRCQCVHPDRRSLYAARCGAGLSPSGIQGRPGRHRAGRFPGRLGKSPSLSRRECLMDMAYQHHAQSLPIALAKATRTTSGSEAAWPTDDCRFGRSTGDCRRNRGAGSQGRGRSSEARPGTDRPALFRADVDRGSLHSPETTARDDTGENASRQAATSGYAAEPHDGEVNLCTPTH